MGGMRREVREQRKCREWGEKQDFRENGGNEERSSECVRTLPSGCRRGTTVGTWLRETHFCPSGRPRKPSN